MSASDEQNLTGKSVSPKLISTLLFNLVFCKKWLHFLVNTNIFTSEYLQRSRRSAPIKFESTPNRTRLVNIQYVTPVYILWTFGDWEAEIDIFLFSDLSLLLSVMYKSWNWEKYDLFHDTYSTHFLYTNKLGLCVICICIFDKFTIQSDFFTLLQLKIMWLSYHKIGASFFLNLFPGLFFLNSLKQYLILFQFLNDSHLIFGKSEVDVE